MMCSTALNFNEVMEGPFLLICN